MIREWYTVRGEQLKTVKGMILDYLREHGESCAKEMREEFGLSRQALWCRLANLSRAGLIEKRRDGHSLIYRISSQ